jgi:hypothetical protein
MPLAPSGELTSIGVGRETTFGSPVVPTTFLISDDLSYLGMNEFLERPGSRKRIGRTKPSTGMFTGKATGNFEFDPDNTGALLALTMGAEVVTTNLANPAAAAVTSTLSAATAIGFVDFTPAAMTNITVGQSLTIDTSTQAETVVVKAITPTTFRAYGTKTHASGVAVVDAAVVLAYDHTFTLGSPRGFFTSQINRITDAVAFTGGKVSTLSVAVGEKAIITGKLGVEYQNEVYVSTPATPAYSTLFPFKFMTVGNSVLLDGAVSDADIIDWNFVVNTGLITDFPVFGNGRLRGQLPEAMTKVSGGMTLAFETATLYQKFWGKRTATGPQSLVLPVSLAFVLQSDDYVNTAVPYALQVIMATCMLSADDVAIKSADYLKQAVKFECYESINGAADDVKLILTNAASAVSI